jgi:hypothetical protein
MKRKRVSKRIITSSEDSTIAEEDPIEEVLESSIVKSAINAPSRQPDQSKTLLDKYCPLLTV